MGGMAQIRCGKVVYPPCNHTARVKFLLQHSFHKHPFTVVQENLISYCELGLYKPLGCDIFSAYDAFDIQRKHQIGSTDTHALNKG
jgi:hypothetical protein